VGLDIYVGPLSRYYSGQWQNIIQQFGQANGLPVTVIRPRPPLLTRLRDLFIRRVNPKSVNLAEAVHIWRTQLAAASGPFPPDADWNWPESPDLDYDTDKPSFFGYGAVRTWAAYSAAAPPELLRDDWEQDPLVQQSENAAFPHLHQPELWLPVRFPQVIEAPELSGNPIKIGSVFSLWDEFQALNAATWNADHATIRQWKNEDFDDEKLEPTARWAFSIWFCLTERAVKHLQPMRLDY
jgi:hypothetical protein